MTWILLAFAALFIILIVKRKRRKARAKKLQWTRFIENMEYKSGDLPEA